MLARISVFIIVAYLTGCGGGGGTDSETTQQQSDTPGKQINSSEFKLAGYSGNEKVAKFNLSNARDIAQGVLYLADIVHIYSGLMTELDSPDYLKYPGYMDDTSNYDDSPCDSGDYSIEDNRNESTGLGTFIANFENCYSDNTTISGKLVFEIQEVYSPNEPKKYTLKIEELKVISGDEQQILHLLSDVKVEGSQYQIVADVMLEASKSSESTNKIQLYGKNLVINQRYDRSELSGRIYENDFGYVDVATNEADKIIRLTAADETLLDLDLRLDNENSYGNFIESIAMTLSLGKQPFEVFHTRVSSEQFFIGESKKNHTPELIVSDNITTDRMQTAVITTVESTDLESDFLQTNWRIIASPENCDYQWDRFTNQVIHFYSPCAGEYQLGVSLSDGYSITPEKIVTVEFLKLDAVMKVSDSLEASYNSVFTTQLEVENAVDGPYEFSLLYGPNGMSIDKNGLVTYDPTSIIRQARTEVSFGVAVNNGKSVTYKSSISLNDENATTTELKNLPACNSYPGSGRLADLDNDGTQECLSTDSIIEFADTGVRYQWNLPNYYSQNLPLKTTHGDMDGDGIDEIFIAFEESIVQLDGATKVLEATYKYPFSGKLLNIDLRFIQEGNVFTLIVHNVYSGDIYFIDLETKDSTTLKTFASISDIGNVDADNDVEILFNDGKILDRTNSTITDLSDQYGEYQLVDLDNNGVDEVVLLSNSVDVLDPVSGAIINTYNIELPDGQLYWSWLTKKWFNDSIPNQPAELIVFDRENPVKLFRYQIMNNEIARLPDVTIDPEIKDLNLYIGDNGEYFGSAYNYNNSGALIGRYFWLTSQQDHLVNYNIDHIDLFNSSLMSDPFYNPDNNSIDFYNIDNVSSVMTYTDSGTHEYSVDLNTKETTAKSLGFTVYEQQWGIGYFKFDVNGDDIDEVFIGDNEINEFKAFDLDNENLLSETHFGLDFSGVIDSKVKDLNNEGKQYLFISKVGDIDVDLYDSFYIVNLQNETIEWEFPIKQLVTDFEVIDLDRDGIDEIILLANNNIISAIDLYVYRKIGGDYQQVLKEQLTESYAMATNLGVQDVDNDNKLEIIVAANPLISDSKNTVYIIDDNLKLLPHLELSEAISDLPTIDSNEPKKNFIGAVTTESENMNYASYVIEFDVSTGQKIWNSPPYSGKINPGGTYFFGDNIYDSTKWIRTSNQIYIIE